MDLHILQKAQDRQRTALKAIERMRLAETLEDQEDDWFTFLRAWKGIYTMLEQAVKGDPKAVMWFGKKNAFRRHDQLLQYLYQARNDDEHGLTRVTSRAPGEIKFGKPTGPGPSKLGSITISKTENVITIIDGGGHENFDPSFEITGPRLLLMPVKDRDRSKFYNPPEEHLGRPFEDGRTPLTVADAALIYTRGLLEEARNL